MATNLKLERIERNDRYETVYLVRRNETPIGLLTKIRNTRTDKHPWKGFVGVGMASRYLGAWYPNEGGKAAALAAVETGCEKV